MNSRGALTTRLWRGHDTLVLTHIYTHSQWGILVPVAALRLHKWSKADPHSQPCVRLPFIPQPSLKHWVMGVLWSSPPSRLGLHGAPCGLTLFAPTQGQWSCWLGKERERGRGRGKGESGRQRDVDSVNDWEERRGIDKLIRVKESVLGRRSQIKIASLLTEKAGIRNVYDRGEGRATDRHVR